MTTPYFRAFPGEVSSFAVGMFIAKLGFNTVELRRASYNVEERTPYNLADLIVQQHNRDEWQYFNSNAARIRFHHSDKRGDSDE